LRQSSRIDHRRVGEGPTQAGDRPAQSLHGVAHHRSASAVLGTVTISRRSFQELSPASARQFSA
jgi:hypothetical protein